MLIEIKLVSKENNVTHLWHRILLAILICALLAPFYRGYSIAAETSKTIVPAPRENAPPEVKKQASIIFRGLDLSASRVDDNKTQLTDIYDYQLADSNGPSKSYKISLRKEVKVYKVDEQVLVVKATDKIPSPPPKTHTVAQKVFYAADKDVFYVQYREGPFASAAFYYGPFKGDPVKVLNFDGDKSVSTVDQLPTGAEGERKIPPPKQVNAPAIPPGNPPVVDLKEDKPIVFRGLDLSAAPAGNDPNNLTDIFDLQTIYKQAQREITSSGRPITSKQAIREIISSGRAITNKQSFREGVKVYKVKDNDPQRPGYRPDTQRVYYISDNNVFYVQYVDNIAARSVQFYGPFKGDPVKLWRLADPDVSQEH
jgi:hypothetical protein